MQKDAESHAEEDKRKRQLAEERNKADTMCWSMEKLLKEHDAKLAAADKEAVQKAIEKCREAAKSDDLEKIKSATGELEQASHALSKTLYEKAGVNPNAAPGAGPTPDAAPTGSTGGDDDTIDAEFEVK
jgi:molecular chaperone DnaK